MAMSNGAAALADQYLHIEAIQTVPPQKITAEPRPARQVSITDLTGSGIFKRSLNVILCYNKSTEEDTGYLVAGWIKESLGNAMSEEPMLSGRFRVSEKRGESEVVANDSGVRLVEGKISMSLHDFLNSKGRKDIEANLVFWRDINEENPQYSPLVYVQVTNFECGGYSIGISCSILLADLLMMSNFLHKWTQIHKNLMSQNDAKKLPLFYFHDNEKAKIILTSQITSNHKNNSNNQTMIYKIPRENPLEYSYKDLALLAIEKTEKQIGTKLGQEIYLFVQESANTIKIENYDKDNKLVGVMSPGNDMLNARWDELGEISFYEKNKPAHFSYWIGSRHGGEDEVVIALASPDKNKVDENNFIFIVLNRESNSNEV
ncbi:hypothetical protein ACFE04_028045 [Oxalis oulophora]